ncbi:MAG: ATP-binding cassette domain-containing protein [Planctomycetota bacterium]
MAASFELRGAAVAFGGRTVLSEIDLRIGAGEAVAIVGPSGSGKTTLLRLLGGTLRPTQGSVRMNGTELGQVPRAELRAVRSTVGFIHQDHSLVPILRVVQNVLAGKLGQRGFWRSARTMLWPSPAELETAHTLLERVGIPEKLFHRTDTLSGGQQQRVAIARALYQDPGAILADEPVASVDPARGRDLLRLLTELAQEGGLTLVASLHDLDMARSFLPRTVGLREGRVMFDAPTSEIPQSDFEELYRLEGLNGEAGQHGPH